MGNRNTKVLKEMGAYQTAGVTNYYDTLDPRRRDPNSRDVTHVRVAISWRFVC